MCVYIWCFHACMGSHLQQFVFTLHAMNSDILKHNRIKSPLRMSYASKGTAFWDTCYNSYDYVILVILVANGCGWIVVLFVGTESRSIPHLTVLVKLIQVTAPKKKITYICPHIRLNTFVLTLLWNVVHKTMYTARCYQTHNIYNQIFALTTLDYKQNYTQTSYINVPNIRLHGILPSTCTKFIRNMRFLRWWWRWMLCRAVRQTYAGVSEESAASFFRLG